MATEKPYTILVCDPKRRLYEPNGDDDDELNAGLLWEACGTFEAASGAKAIEKLWERCPEMKVNTELRYFAVANFKPKRQRRSYVERWTLDDAELPDDEVPGQMEMSS